MGYQTVLEYFTTANHIFYVLYTIPTEKCFRKVDTEIVLQSNAWLSKENIIRSVTTLLNEAYFFCCRSSSQFSVEDMVNVFKIDDDLDVTIPSGSEDERLKSGESGFNVDSDYIPEEETAGSIGSDDEASIHEKADDKESEHDDKVNEVSKGDSSTSESEANDMSARGKKSVGDDCLPESPQTKKRKSKSKKGKKQKVWKWTSKDLNHPGARKVIKKK